MIYRFVFLKVWDAKILWNTNASSSRNSRRIFVLCSLIEADGMLLYYNSEYHMRIKSSCVPSFRRLEIKILWAPSAYFLWLHDLCLFLVDSDITIMYECSRHRKHHACLSLQRSSSNSRSSSSTSNSSISRTSSSSSSIEVVVIQTPAAAEAAVWYLFFAPSLKRTECCCLITANITWELYVADYLHNDNNQAQSDKFRQGLY